MRKQKGFTLVEVLIYTGLTAVIVGLLGSILITITRVQSQQGASTDVTSELNFLMTTIKRHIRDTVSINSISPTVINITTNSNSSTPPTIIELLDNKIYIDAGSGTESLSSENIKIDQLNFLELVGSSNRAIQITITASIDTPNEAQSVTKTLQSTAAPLKKPE